MKSCKKGYYYCNTEQKCKPIPDGFTVKDDGFLVKEDKQIKKIVKQLRKSVKSHAKQADTLEKKITEGKKDHEPEMIRNQLKTAGRASKRIEKHSRKKDNFKAWVQSKITKASDYLDTAADYLDSKEVNEEGLRAWFGKSSGTTKSGRKVKGWVQVGGKYDGKPCARQPGQKTTPKCTSSSKRASMSDKERDSAARRKRAADPNQPQKSGAAAPTMVSTDPKKKMKEEFTTLPLRLEIPKTQSDFTKGLMFRESLETNGGMLFVFDRVAQQSFHMTETTIPLDIAFIGEDGIIESIKPLEPRDPNPVYSDGSIELAIEVNRGWFAENNVEVGDELVVEYIVENPKEKYRSETGTIFDIINEVKDKKGKGSGTKDACYHKVKSRYSVWPSAYASGALVKCRKVGAANWGNKTKKEGLEIQNSDGKTIAGVVDIIGPDNLQPITNDNGVWKGTQQVVEAKIREETLDEKCWKGYEKKGMKTMFGKRYPNCVKKKVGESYNWREEVLKDLEQSYEGKDEVKKLSEDDMKGMSVKSGHKRPTKSGAGMTQKGVEAYRRRNPGSKLKTAVTTEPSKLKKGSKAANRRKSYCARSAGQMKKFPKAAKDPNSRLRQARRRWNC